MMEILYFVVVGIVSYVFYRKMNGQTLTGKHKKPLTISKTKESKKKLKKGQSIEDLEKEEEALLFRSFLEDIQEIENHMIRYEDNTFVLIAEAHPVNYYLLSQEEQEVIDIRLETWLASLEYNTKVHIQSRYVDLTEPLREMQKTMSKAKNLTPATILYGQEVIDRHEAWQRSRPRYEKKRYILFPYTVDISQMHVDTEDELEEKIIEKAFNELYRRFHASKSSLRKAKIDIEMLTKEGIIELLYVAFNRRKAIKNRFPDLVAHQNFSLYSTADTTDRKLELIKKEIEKMQKEKNQNIESTNSEVQDKGDEVKEDEVI